MYKDNKPKATATAKPKQKCAKCNCGNNGAKCSKHSK